MVDKMIESLRMKQTQFRDLGVGLAGWHDCVTFTVLDSCRGLMLMSRLCVFDYLE